jgi:hypothetical protein
MATLYITADITTPMTVTLSETGIFTAAESDFTTITTTATAILARDLVRNGAATTDSNIASAAKILKIATSLEQITLANFAMALSQLNLRQPRHYPLSTFRLCSQVTVNVSAPSGDQSRTIH